MGRVCKGCGERAVFRSDKKYCSIRCWYKNGRKQNLTLKSCGHCEKGFWSYSCLERKFCSKRCYGASKRLGRRKCIGCRKIFEPWNSKQKYCSIRCAARYKVKTGRAKQRCCSQCGGIFRGYRKPKKTGKLFCSMVCYGRYLREEYVKRNTLTCLNCKKRFIKPTNAQDSKEAPRKFCKRMCMFLFWSKHAKGGAMSSAEVIVNLALRSLHSWAPSYRKQFNPLASFTAVDFFVPSKKLCIYVDGEYWHSRPHARERDLRQTRILEAAGFRVLRVSDKEIHKLGTDGINRLLTEKYGGKQWKQAR